MLPYIIRRKTECLECCFLFLTLNNRRKSFLYRIQEAQFITKLQSFMVKIKTRMCGALAEQQWISRVIGGSASLLRFAQMSCKWKTWKEQIETFLLVSSDFCFISRSLDGDWAERVAVVPREPTDVVASTAFNLIFQSHRPQESSLGLWCLP